MGTFPVFPIRWKKLEGKGNTLAFSSQSSQHTAQHIWGSTSPCQLMDICQGPSRCYLNNKMGMSSRAREVKGMRAPPPAPTSLLSPSSPLHTSEALLHSRCCLMVLGWESSGGRGRKILLQTTQMEGWAVLSPGRRMSVSELAEPTPSSDGDNDDDDGDHPPTSFHLLTTLL